MGFEKISMVTVGLTMTAAVLFTAACTPSPPPAKTVFDPLTHDIDRARDVQKAVDANSEATRKAVQAQENGDSSP